MTALNGIVQRDAVHLLTDGATYRPDGRITAIGTKVMSYPEAGIAIGWSGFSIMRDIHLGVRKRGVKTGREIFAALPSILQDAVASFDRDRERLKQIPWRWFAKGEPPEPDLSVLIALWDKGPQLWAIYTDNTFIPPPYVPFTPVRLGSYLDGIMPGTEPAIFGRVVNLADARSFDAARDGLTLLEHQRRQPFDEPGYPQYCVGGIAELTTVSAAGVHSTTLREWPDRVGRKIMMEAA